MHPPTNNCTNRLYKEIDRNGHRKYGTQNAKAQNRTTQKTNNIKNSQSLAMLKYSLISIMI
jgi:hypothetical protein